MRYKSKYVSALQLRTLPPKKERERVRAEQGG